MFIWIFWSQRPMKSHPTVMSSSRETPCVCIQTYIRTHTYIRVYTYITYLHIHTYVQTYTHTHTQNLHSLTQDVHCFLQSPQANSITTPVTKPRPIQIRYYTNKVPFDVTQHEVLAASLNYKQDTADTFQVIHGLSAFTAVWYWLL